MKKLQMTVVVFLVSFCLAMMLPAASEQSTGKKPVVGETQGKLVNINSASVQELATLPRIGEKIAERIVQFRKDNGPFKRKQDIMKVKGIGEKLYALIEKQISI